MLLNNCLYQPCLFRGNGALQHTLGNIIQVWGSCMKPFPCQGTMNSYPQLEEVKKKKKPPQSWQDLRRSGAAHTTGITRTALHESALLQAPLPSVSSHSTPAAPGTSVSKTLLTCCPRYYFPLFTKSEYFFSLQNPSLLETSIIQHCGLDPEPDEHIPAISSSNINIFF